MTQTTAVQCIGGPIDGQLVTLSARKTVRRRLPGKKRYRIHVYGFDSEVGRMLYQGISSK